MTDAPCTQDEFCGFFLTTAYDALGNGSFSRHLKAKTARGEEWAVQLSKQHSLTAGVVHKLVSSVNAKWEPGGGPLADIIQRTINSLSPPKLPQAEEDRKHNQLVQMLWVCARLEHIIWCFATAWFAGFLEKNQSRENKATPSTYAEIAEEMAEATKGDAARLYRLFVKAHACVRDAVNEAK